MSRVAWSEGDWIALPLPGGGYAAALIARGKGSGLFVAYFMPDRYPMAPDLSDVHERTPGDALLIARVGDGHVRNGTWPIVGRQPGWSRDAWPLPRFIREDSLTGRRYEVEYADTDPSRAVAERPVDPSTEGPADALLGSTLAEWLIGRLTSG